jgi:hypothetical protein
MSSQGGFNYPVDSMTPEDLNWYVKRAQEQAEIDKKAIDSASKKR